MNFTSACAAVLFAAAVPTQDGPAWLLVKSDAEPGARGDRTLASFGWERLAAAYLRRDYRIVGADAADAHPPSSRLVAGTPASNAAVRELAAELGVTFDGRQVSFRGRTFPDDAGLAVVTADPDGGGTLALFVGATELGAFHCISVPVNLAEHGWVAMTYRKVVARGDIENPVRVADDVLRIVRLDRDLFRIRREVADSPDEAALRISRAFAGYQHVFDGAVEPGVDLFEFTREQLRGHGAMLDAVERRFAGVDLDELLDGIDRRVTAALGAHDGPRPIVHVIVTKPGITNAQVIGRDDVTGRARMTINLAAFEDVDSLRVAVTHEFVHTLQQSHRGTLLDRSIHEGVATYVSQRLVPDTPDHVALMWTAEKLAAAKQREPQILAAFTKLKDSRDMRRIGQFYYAGAPLRVVDGAPDRCGYYVGWRAVAAWHAANPDRTLADLLRVTADELFAALDG